MTPLPYANNQILFSDNMRTVSLRDSSAYCQYSTSFPQLVVLLKSKGVGEVAKIQSYYAEHFLIRLWQNTLSGPRHFEKSHGLCLCNTPHYELLPKFYKF